MAPCAVGCLSEGGCVNEFRASSIIGFLSILLQQKHALQKAKAVFQGIAADLTTQVLGLLRRQCARETVKVKHARETLKFLQQLVKAAQAPDVDVQLDEAGLRETLGALLEAKLCAVSPPIRTVTVQVLRAVGGEVPAPQSAKKNQKAKKSDTEAGREQSSATKDEPEAMRAAKKPKAGKKKAKKSKAGSSSA